MTSWTGEADEDNRSWMLNIHLFSVTITEQRRPDSLTSLITCISTDSTECEIQDDTDGWTLFIQSSNTLDTIQFPYTQFARSLLGTSERNVYISCVDSTTQIQKSHWEGTLDRW